MRVILILLTLLSANIQAEQDTILERFIEYGYKINNTQDNVDASHKNEMRCAFTWLYNNLSDEEKGIVQIALDHSDTFPEKRDKEIGNEVFSQYDPDNRLRSLFVAKAESLAAEFQSCIEN